MNLIAKMPRLPCLSNVLFDDFAFIRGDVGWRRIQAASDAIEAFVVILDRWTDRYLFSFS
jgi:hypothetical protein